MLTGVGCGGVLKKEQRSSLAKFCIMWGSSCNRVSFWHDTWCGPIPLKELFPSMYDCSVSKEA